MAGQAGALLSAALKLNGGAESRCIVISAWARVSGVGRIADDLMAFRRAGGTALALISIDLKGTTEEGLRAVLDVTDEAYVVHDHGRSFHPKIYTVIGPTGGLALIGSGNLTAGGLYSNYEYFDAWDLDPIFPDARDVIADVDGFVRDLRGDRAVTKRLSTTFLKQLVSRGLVESEARSVALDDPALGKGAGNLFGSRAGMQAPPRIPKRFRPNIIPSAASATPSSKFEKRLSRNDVQATGSHQAGIYVPKPDIGHFPQLNPGDLNPEAWIRVIDQQGTPEWWRFVYFNSQLHGKGSRNEFRLTSTGPFINRFGALLGQQLVMERRAELIYAIRVE